MPVVGHHDYSQHNEAQGGVFGRVMNKLDPNLGRIPDASWRQYVPYISGNLIRNLGVFAAGTGLALATGGTLSALGLIVAGASAMKVWESVPSARQTWDQIINRVVQSGVEGTARVAITAAIEMSKSVLEQVKAACLKLWEEVKNAFSRQKLPLNMAALLVSFVILSLGYFYLGTNRPLATALGWGFLALLVVVSSCDPVFEYAQQLAAPLVNPAPVNPDKKSDLASLFVQARESFEGGVLRPVHVRAKTFFEDVKKRIPRPGVISGRETKKGCYACKPPANSGPVVAPALDIKGVSEKYGIHVPDPHDQLSAPSPLVPDLPPPVPKPDLSAAFANFREFISSPVTTVLSSLNEAADEVLKEQSNSDLKVLGGFTPKEIVSPQPLVSKIVPLDSVKIQKFEHPYFCACIECSDCPDDCDCPFCTHPDDCDGSSSYHGYSQCPVCFHEGGCQCDNCKLSGNSKMPVIDQSHSDRDDNEDSCVLSESDNEAQAGGKSLIGGLACFGYALLAQKAPTTQKDIRFTSEIFRAGQNVSEFISDIFTVFPSYVEQLIAWMRGTTTRQQELFKYCDEIINKSEMYLAMNNSMFDSACSQSMFCDEFLVNYNRLSNLRDTVVRDSAFNTSHKSMVLQLFMRMQDYYKKVISLATRQKVRMQPLSVWFEGAPGAGKSRMINMFLSALRCKLVSAGLETGVFNDNMRHERKQETEFWDGYHGQWATTFDDIFQSLQAVDRTRMSMEFIQAVNSASFPLNMAHLDNKGVVMFESKVVVSTTNNIGVRIVNPGIFDPKAIYRRRDMIVRVELDLSSGIHESSPECYKNYVLHLVREDANGNEILKRLSFRQLIDFSAGIYARNASMARGFEQDFTYDWNQAQMGNSHYEALPSVDTERDEIKNQLLLRFERDKNFPVPAYPAFQPRPVPGNVSLAFGLPTDRGFWESLASQDNVVFSDKWCKSYANKKIYAHQCIVAHASLLAWHYLANGEGICPVLIRNFGMQVRTSYDAFLKRCKDIGTSGDGQAIYQMCEYLYFCYDFYEQNFLDTLTPRCSFQTLFEFTQVMAVAIVPPKYNFEYFLGSFVYVEYHARYRLFSFVTLREHFRLAKEQILNHPWITGLKVIFTLCIFVGIVHLVRLFFNSICSLFGASPADTNSANSNAVMRDRIIRSQQKNKQKQDNFTWIGKNPPVAHPNLAQGGALATKNLAKKLMNNNIALGVIYADGQVCKTRIQMLRGFLGVSVSHPFRYSQKIEGLCLYGYNPEETGVVLVRPEKYRLKFIPGKDLVYIMFQKGYMNAFKDIIKKHLFEGESLESAPYPTRVSTAEEQIFLHSGSFVVRGRENCNSMAFNGVMLSEPVNDYWYAIGVPGAEGLCAYPYILENDGVAKKFIGIHTAASGSNSCFSRIERKDFEGFDDDNIAQSGVLVPESHPDLFKLNPLTQPTMKGVHVLGTLKRGADYMPKKSKIRPTPLQQFSNPTKIPALLKKTEIDGELVDPLKQALSKYGLKKNTCQTKLPQPEYRSLWPTGMRNRTFRMLTIEEAIFGCPELEVVAISRQPSPGYPWVWMGLSREQLIDFEQKTIDPRLRKMIEDELKNLKAGLISLVYLDCLKDETRPIEKVQAGKTRLFARASLHQYILARMLFAPLLAAIHSKGLSPFSIGIDPCSAAWRNLCRSMYKYGGKKILNGDFSNYDVFHIFSFALQVYIAIAGFFSTVDHRRMVLNYLLSRAQAIHVCLSTVYVALGSSPSGDFLTIFYNTIVNFYMHRVVFLLLYPLFDVDEHVTDSYEGDDSIIAANDTVPKYNMVTVSRMFRDIWGYEYTAPDKTLDLVPYVTMETATFCQRGFSQPHTSLVLAPLNTVSIHNIPLWTEDRERHVSIVVAELVDVAMREWLLYDKSVFELKKNEINEWLTSLGYERYNKTYDMLYQRFVAHYEL
jgi:hypothetical protein